MDTITHRARGAHPLIATLAVVTALAAMPVALADTYFGFGSGRAHLDDRLFGSSGEFTADDTSEHYFFGLGLGRHTRLEVGRVDLGVLEDRVSLGGTPTTVRVAAEGATYSLLFSERIAEDLALYLRAGVFEWEREVDGVGGTRQRGGNGLFGVGASLRVTRDLTLRAEYQRFEMGEVNVDAPVLSIAYHF